MDAGDFFGAIGEQDSLKTAFLIDAMDRLGYDVVTVGERELNFGTRFLIDSFKKTKMDLVSANLVYADSKRPLVKPYVIRKAGAVRVAFTGLLSKDVRLRQRAEDPALEIMDPVEVAKRLVPELRKKADLVVVLSHLGLTENQKLPLDVPGIDVMVFGHMSGLYRSLIKTHDVINVRGGERGQYIPMMHLVVEDKKITSFDGDVVELSDKIPADPEMDDRVDTFSDQLNERFSKANQTTAAGAARETAAQIAGDRFLGEKNCRRCHEAEYQMYASQAHAHAFDTLIRNQRESTPECLPCHVVGYGQPSGFVSKQGTPGLINVQCENCHGIGTQHPQPGSVAGPEVCLSCHTSEQSPNFEYDEALQKIVHWQ